MLFEGRIDDDGVRLLAEHETGDEFYAQVQETEYGTSFTSSDPDTLAEEYDEFRKYLEMETGAYDLHRQIEIRDGREEDSLGYHVRYRLEEPRLPGDFEMDRGEIAHVCGDVPKDLAPDLESHLDGELPSKL